MGPGTKKSAKSSYEEEEGDEVAVKNSHHD